MHKNKAKGTEFERRVVRALKNDGWYAIRQGSSRFPDIIAIKRGETAKIIECKLNKYISSTEKTALRSMDELFGDVYVAYRRLSKKDKRKTEIVLCDLEYKEVFVL